MNYYCLDSSEIQQCIVAFPKRSASKRTAWSCNSFPYLSFSWTEGEKRVCNISFWREICSPSLTPTQPGDKIMKTWPVGYFLFLDTSPVLILIPDCNLRRPKVATEQDVITSHLPLLGCGDKEPFNWTHTDSSALNVWNNPSSYSARATF